MVLKHYYDIGVAVGAAEGLVVPVLRDADRASFAEHREGAFATSRSARTTARSRSTICAAARSASRTAASTAR